ncbi:SH2 domain-containing protein 3C [Brachyhypopomus gauderio]|uniref:SH2 domain-containing protein 3C n=1 Tax=Brachyhypopomus gauderio TaxID=698409 RepID=UPI004042BEC4
MIKRKLSFKWFGSLSNLSFRRKSDAAKDGSPKEEDGSARTSVDSEMSVDDMDMRSRCPSYARSNAMYTHMGTMPRHEKKKEKTSKTKPQEQRSVKMKMRGKSSLLGRSQSVRPSAEHVCESPLLGVLSEKGLSILDTCAHTLPEPVEDGAAGDEVFAEQTVKPRETPWAPVLNTVVSDGSHRDPGNASSGDTNLPLASHKSTDLQDKPALPVKGDRARKTSQELGRDASFSAKRNKTKIKVEKREDNLVPGPAEVKHTESQMGTTDIQGEYVEFSKEKYLLESPPEKLRKELEEELKLSSSDMRSHGWYHGRIPREVSETLVLRSGDFLVRDSLASAGEYVITCCWQQEVVHCRVSEVVSKGSSSRPRYALESETFDSVPTLVRHHAGTGRPVCPRTGAQLLCPVNRTLPLRYLEATFSLGYGRSAAMQSPSSQRGAHIKRRSVTMTDGLTTEKIIPHSPSTVHHKDVMRNCALSMDQIQEFRCPLSPVGETPLSPAYSSVSRHRHGSGGRILAVIPPSPVMRRSSEPHLSPSSSNNNLPCSDTPPSAPSNPSDGTEGGGNYCELRPSQPPTPPSKSYVERLRAEESGTPGSSPADGGDGFALPLVETSSWFKPGSYQSALLPVENKPLEMGVLKKVKELLAEVDPNAAAKHITKVDCMVARILGVTKEMQKMMGVGSGLELLTLPHGHQLRLDLLERFYTMSIMMAVDLLGCTGSTEERAALLHKTIQLAAELKSTMGNMFGFAAIMRTLELPQISRLEQTWMALRQRHTEGAILYEKKLKPFIKAMNDGKESSVLSSTVFPHIVPVLSLLERGVAVGEGLEPWENSECGVDVVMSHLEAARSIAHHGGLYRSNAESKLEGFQEREEVLEIFCTEFQMRLLWGSRGSEGSQPERYEKFDKVLTALSHKLEPPVRHSEL